MAESTSFSLSSQGGLTRPQVEGAIAFVRQANPEIAPWFGVPDTEMPPLTGKPWAAYLRQSDDKQAGNNMFFDYLLTCGRMAQARQVVVPLSLVFYDDETGAHLDRPAFSRLRREYLEQSRIAGIIIPDLWRLTREADHLGIFERWCEHYQVEYFFGGGVPNGTDEYSKMTRRIVCSAGTLQRKSVNQGNLGGRLARVRRGLVRTGKLPIGYRMSKQMDSSGRVLDAQWVPDTLVQPGPAPVETFTSEAQLAAYFAPDTGAWTVGYIFYQMVVGGWSTGQIATALAEAGVRTPQGGKWSHANVIGIVRNPCYYGEGVFNQGRQEANPERKMALDMTSAPQRTVRRRKPEAEHVTFTVPPLVTRAAWDRAQERIEYFRHHRGASTPRYPALLRGLIYCPVCAGPMRLWHHSDKRYAYYICSNNSRQDAYTRCDYKVRVQSQKVDAVVMAKVQALAAHPENLRVLVDAQQTQEMAQVLRLQLDACQTAVTKLEKKKVRIREGWANGLYDSAEEAKGEMETVREELAAAQAALDQAQEALVRHAQQQVGVEGLIEALRALNEHGSQDWGAVRVFLENAQAVFVPTRDLRTGEGVLGFRNLTYQGANCVSNEGVSSRTTLRNTILPRWQVGQRLLLVG